MDRGAHYHRCDFQVHTPRDRNWSGNAAVTDDDRKKYATAFISACRGKGLDAVAITDHHDLTFYPYIKKAAQDERDSEGQPIPETQQIVVFPGMELTLGIPCQALLILDAEFPLNLLDTLYTVLSITPARHAEAHNAEVLRLGQFSTFKELHKRLDEITYLKGRYIVLPNVTDGGHSTLQRQGFSEHYKAMACVGGYLDGPYEKMGDGDKRILDGKVDAYGFKPLGIFPTSDSRDGTFSTLGKHTAWVKWSIPTAEALRQACLARHTRILHSSPLTPGTVITALHVSNCKFMGPIDLEFNHQCNCLIGGRGTGKSTILEYLRWALCDQPPSVGDSVEMPDVQAKRAALITNTLVPHQGTVTVEFLVNGVKHTVRRASHDKQLLMRIGNDEYRPCSEDDVRGILGIQAYSQKQLSSVGVRRVELLRFVQSPVKRQLSELAGTMDDLKANIRSAYALMLRKKVLARDIAKVQFELSSLERQVQSLRESLQGLTEDDQTILKQHDPYAQEQSILATWDRDIKRGRESLESITKEITCLPSRHDTSSVLPNQALITEIGSEIRMVLDSVQASLEVAATMLADTGPAMSGVVAKRQEWERLFTQHASAYSQIKAKASAQEVVLSQIMSTEQRIAELRSILIEKEEQYRAHGMPEEDYRIARATWTEVYERQAVILGDRCEALTDLSSGVIRATLRKGAGVAGIENQLGAIISGTRIQGKKVGELCALIGSTDEPVSRWWKVLEELELLAAIEPVENTIASLPLTPLLMECFTENDIEKLTRKITPQEWLELSLAELEDVPVFEFKLSPSEYIDFADASAGQQATALLTVLLNQEGPPLVIDQPEDDLDNQVIFKVVNELWEAKKRRQIIISSHNANLVVNGDADLVIVCDYRAPGVQSGGRIKAEGSIDGDEIKAEIKTIMEGGEEAFRMRKEKYGF